MQHDDFTKKYAPAIEELNDNLFRLTAKYLKDLLPLRQNEALGIALSAHVSSIANIALIISEGNEEMTKNMKKFINVLQECVSSQDFVEGTTVKRNF